MRKFFLILFVLSNVFACDLEFDNKGQAFWLEESDSLIGEPLAIENSIAEENEENETVSDWQRFSEGPRSFYYKKGWQAEEKVFDVDFGKKYQIKVRNVSGQPVLGAILPTDYWQNGSLNERYSADYILIRVDQYEFAKSESWADFFALSFAGVIDEYEIYQVPYRDDLMAVKETRLSGKLSGSQRFFVKSGNKIYDVGLYCSGGDWDLIWFEFVDFIYNFEF